MRAATLQACGEDDAMLAPQELTALRRYALKLTGDANVADDLCQETCLRAWKGRDALRDGAAARPWLLRIAVNLWRDRLRRKLRRPAAASLDAEAVDPPAPQASPVERGEDLARTLAALEGLPPMQRDAVFLAAVEGMTRGEIAALLGTTPGAVKANLSIGRAKLREQLSDIVADL